MKYLAVDISQVEDIQTEEPEIKGVFSFAYLICIFGRTITIQEVESNVVSKGRDETDIKNSALCITDMAIK
jgi:hypothetical protein